MKSLSELYLQKLIKHLFPNIRIPVEAPISIKNGSTGTSIYLLVCPYRILFSDKIKSYLNLIPELNNGTVKVKNFK